MAKKPNLPDRLIYVWQAFWRLCGDRPYFDAGRGSISFAAIDGYARRFGVDEIDQFERFLELIRAMDRTFLEWTPPADG